MKYKDITPDELSRIKKRAKNITISQSLKHAVDMPKSLERIVKSQLDVLPLVAHIENVFKESK